MADERLRLEYIPLEQCRHWDKNPKKHDIGAIAESILRHGFKDPPKFEPALNNGEGGLAEGNGRMDVLLWLKHQGRKPKGIIETENGKWLIPVLFGVDDESEAAATAYAIDHNNLTMAGGDMTQFDMAKLWDSDEYLALLNEMAMEGEFAESVSGDDLDALNFWLMGEGAERAGEKDDNDDDGDGMTDDELGEAFWPTLKIEISPDNLNLWRKMQKSYELKDNDLISKILIDQGFLT